MKQDGTGLLYSTYIGGLGTAWANAIAVDPADNAYITGGFSSGYPTTAGAYTSGSTGSYSAFITKLTAVGDSLGYSAIVGGYTSTPDEGKGIAVNAAGEVFVTGVVNSFSYPMPVTRFPATTGQTTFGGGSTDGFALKMTSDGSGLGWSTFLGGGGLDQARVLLWTPAATLHQRLDRIEQLSDRRRWFSDYVGGGTDAWLSS